MPATRAVVPAPTTRTPAAPAVVHATLAAPGRPLDAAARAALEPAFAVDLSAVRIHADRAAARSAEAVSARAYAVGHHVVFGDNQYQPGTSAGRALLAHELAHVVQQGAGRAAVPGPGALRIGAENDPAERAADTLADQALRGDAAPAPAPTLPRLARQVRARIVRDFQPRPADARACLVHLHGDEREALEVGRQLRSRYCVNLVHLDNTSRAINVDIGGGRPDCQADPNRIFTPTGLSSHALASGCADPTTAQSHLATFATSLSAAIRDGRQGSGGLLGGLPLVALHNNTNGGGLSVRSYRPGGTEAGATETDPTRLGGLGNPAINRAEDADNFFLTTLQSDAVALSTGAVGGRSFNAVLQAQTPSDDGSLSVAIAQQALAAGVSDRFINVEAQGKSRRALRSRRGVASPDLVNNLAQGEAVMALLGIAPGPCPAAPSASGSSASPTLQRAMETRDSSPAPLRDPERPQPALDAEPPGAAEPTVEDPLTALLGLFRWILDALLDLLRLSDELSRLPPAAARDPVPPSTAACKTFPGAPDLLAHKATWAAKIAGMSQAEVIAWLVGAGTGKKVKEAKREAARQKDCMLAAMAASARTAGSALHLPSRRPQPGWTVSGERNFASQAGIWGRKFNFTVRSPTRPVNLGDTNPNAFDRITPHARAVCGGLIGAEVKWNPENPAHRVAWGVAPRPGTTAPPMPAGARALTADERQQEILEASSAPGLSRHHWGTDFDLFSVEPEDWEVGHPFADEYSWLRSNAPTWGFIQSFTPLSTFRALGYMPEAWHWSYFPIASALVDFATANASALETELLRRWGTAPEFSYIRANWRSFVFNVNNSPSTP